MFKKIIALVTSFFIVEQVASANETTNSKLLLNTSKGEIVIKFLPDIAPIHVARIIELVKSGFYDGIISVSYTHLRAHETEADLVCRLLLEKKK